ncbi:hypothetical protein EDB92DRAFT_1944349 [Lactarius akahatsu]|uniref:Uncharacterized protein n=1 Tax=Lactarius akahatsu TaxID=416441 RepID=A0AAD4LM76_9AGAM|nr:hypothetical protein EDB92DRAFT_1944349 [Lactarius akahatsu]
MHQSSIRNAGPAQPSHIPVRSPGRVPKIKNGDEKEFTDGHRHATTEFAEASGAIPPTVCIQPSPGPELESTSNSELENLVSNHPKSDESSAQDVLAPIARPIEVPPPDSEKLQSPPPAESLLAQAERRSNPSFDASSLPTSPCLTLSTLTPPGRYRRQFVCDGGLLNLDQTTARASRPPGAWAATPARSQTFAYTIELDPIIHGDTRLCSYPRVHAPRSNTRATWGLVFNNTWLTSSEESHESADQD